MDVEAIIQKIEHIQKRATKIIQGMEHLPYENRLRKLWLLSPENKRLQGDLIAAFQYLKWGCKKEGDRLFGRLFGQNKGKWFQTKRGDI